MTLPQKITEEHAGRKAEIGSNSYVDLKLGIMSKSYSTLILSRSLTAF